MQTHKLGGWLVALEGLGLSLQVDYGGTAEELESHFHSCGEINRVTILCDKFSGHPKGSVVCAGIGVLKVLPCAPQPLGAVGCPGTLLTPSPRRYAYIEFEEKSSVKTALELDKSVFRGRVIKVRVG